MKETSLPPTTCRWCKREFKAARPASWHSSPIAMLLFLLGGAAALVWIVHMVQWVPWEFADEWSLMGRGFFVAVALAGLAPGLLIGFIACALPRVRTLSCRRCGWTVTLKERARSSER